MNLGNFESGPASVTDTTPEHPTVNFPVFNKLFGTFPLANVQQLPFVDTALMQLQHLADEH
jgi:hypothetical protein